MHLINFGSHVTVRSTDRPTAPQAHQYKITQSTGMATQMQLKNMKIRANMNRKQNLS